MRSVISNFILLVSPSSEEHMSACVACGQTAYAFLHLGAAGPMLSGMLLARH